MQQLSKQTRDTRNRFEILCLHDLSLDSRDGNQSCYALSLLIHLCSDGVPTSDGKGKNNKMNKVKKKPYTSITINNIHTPTHVHTLAHVTFLRYRQNTSSICLTCYRDITHIYIFLAGFLCLNNT